MVAWIIFSLSLALVSVFLLIKGSGLGNQARLLGGACFCALAAITLLSFCHQCLCMKRDIEQKQRNAVPIDIKGTGLLYRLLGASLERQRELVDCFTDDEISAHINHIEKERNSITGKFPEKWHFLRTLLVCKATEEVCQQNLWATESKDRIAIYETRLARKDLTTSHADFLIHALLREIEIADTHLWLNNYKELLLGYATKSSPEVFFSTYSKEAFEKRPLVQHSAQELLDCFKKVPLALWVVEKGPRTAELFAKLMYSYQYLFFVAHKEQTPALWAEYQDLLKTTLDHVRPHFILEQRLRADGCYSHLEAYPGTEKQLELLIYLKPKYKERVYQKIVADREKIQELKRFFLESPNSIVLFLPLENALKKAICEQMTLSEIFLFVEKFDPQYGRYEEELLNIAMFCETAIQDCAKLPDNFLEKEIALCLSKKQPGLVYFAATMTDKYFNCISHKRAYSALEKFYEFLKEDDSLKRIFLCNGLLDNKILAKNFFRKKADNNFFLKERERLMSV
jgi:hypothetical protein